MRKVPLQRLPRFRAQPRAGDLPARDGAATADTAGRETFASCAMSSSAPWCCARASRSVPNICRPKGCALFWRTIRTTPCPLRAPSALDPTDESDPDTHVRRRGALLPLLCPAAGAPMATRGAARAGKTSAGASSKRSRPVQAIKAAPRCFSACRGALSSPSWPCTPSHALKRFSLPSAGP